MELSHNATTSTLPPQQILVLCFLATLYALVGTCANALSLSYFITREKTEISRILFICLNSTDLLVCMCMVPQAILNFSVGDIAGMRSVAFCSVFLALFPTALQLSVFVTAVLCLTRAFLLIKPFGRLTKKWVFPILAVYFVLILMRLADLFISDKFYVKYSAERIRCVWIDAKTDDVPRFKVVNMIIVLIILVPTLAGCITSIYILQKKGHRRERPIMQAKREATITVIILTVVSFIANIQYFVTSLMKSNGSNVSIFADNMSLMYSYSLVSVVNPVVYFIRIGRLRKYVKEIVGWAKMPLSNSGFVRRPSNNSRQMLTVI